LEQLYANVRARDKYERLRVLISLWRQYVVRWEINHEQIEELFVSKLNLLFNAAAESGRYYSMAMRLDLVLNHLREIFQLKEKVRPWPSFFDALKDSFQPQSRRKRNVNAPVTSR
jgi:hypothetical protein